MKLILVVLLIFVALSIQAYALGIVTDYGSDLINIPVTQKIAYYSFRLQNMKNEELTLLINVTSEKNIASLMNESRYTIAPMTSSVEFLIELKIPEDAKGGDVYNVSFSIKQLSSQEGQVTLGQVIGKRFQVKIVGTDNPSYAPNKREIVTEQKGNNSVNASVPTAFVIAKNKEISLDFSPVITVIVAVLILSVAYAYKRKKSLRKKILTRY